MRAGKLNHLMRIEVDIVTTDVSGKQSSTRQVIGTAWVKLTPIDLREFGVVPSVSARPSHKVNMRFTSFLPNIFFFISIKDGKEYWVNSLATAGINVDELDKELEILVMENV